MIANLGAPALLAGVGIENVEPAIIGADIDESIGDGRGGIDAVAGGCGPTLLTGVGIEGVELVIPGADVDDAIGDGW